MNESVLPAPGRVLIAPSEVNQQEQEISGLLVIFGAESQACALDRGVVLACGLEVETWWPELGPGSTVLYHGHAANPVGENRLLPCNQLAAIIKDEEA